MNFRIGRDALQREKRGDVLDLIVQQTGRHVNREFIRRCIVAQGYDTVTVDEPNGAPGLIVRFSKTLRRDSGPIR